MGVGDRLEAIGGAADCVVETLRSDSDPSGHRDAAGQCAGLIEVDDGFAYEAGMDTKIAAVAQRPEGCGRNLAKPRLDSRAVADPTRGIARDRLGRRVGARVGHLEQRLLYYKTRDDQELTRIESATAELEGELWSAVQVPTAAQPTAPLTITAMGMNDVLNSRGYTQAAWLNRIPAAAWCLMAAIAIFCNFLIGYGARRGGARTTLLLVLPLVIAISFTLIADIDSPRQGIIRVRPQNLISVAQSLHGQ